MWRAAIALALALGLQAATPFALAWIARARYAQDSISMGTEDALSFAALSASGLLGLLLASGATWRVVLAARPLVAGGVVLVVALPAAIAASVHLLAALVFAGYA